jgi:hypothetical protein
LVYDKSAGPLGGFVGSVKNRLALVTCLLAAILVSACTPQLVSPYNVTLQQKASDMQAEVAAWDLTMRNGAGTVADDPRHPGVAATLNKWRGEADAMLTLAVSNDPRVIPCDKAAKGVYNLIAPSIPAPLRGDPAIANPDGATPLGCDTLLVAEVAKGIDDIEKGLKFCRVEWVPPAWFTGVGQSRSAAPRPPAAAPSQAAQDKLQRSCFAEFRAPSQVPAGAADSKHGRAVSALLTTLQAIVYVESRKKAAQSPK